MCNLHVGSLEESAGQTGACLAELARKSDCESPDSSANARAAGSSAAITACCLCARLPGRLSMGHTQDDTRRQQSPLEHLPGS